MTPAEAASRPRVEGEREQEILDATLALVHEHGYDRLTMDAVAGRARASKATLYRRWETKATLVVDAFERSHEAPDLRDVDTGSLRGDLVASYCGPHGLDQERETRLMASLVTALHTDPEFAGEFRRRFLEPKMAHGRRIFTRARDRGELAPWVDIDVLAPALAGIVLHRVFLLALTVDHSTVLTVIDQIILPAATGVPYSEAVHKTPEEPSPTHSHEGRP